MSITSITTNDELTLKPADKNVTGFEFGGIKLELHDKNIQNMDRRIQRLTYVLEIAGKENTLSHNQVVLLHKALGQLLRQDRLTTPEEFHDLPPSNGGQPKNDS